MVECIDYHRHFNACMYEDYENEDQGSLMGTSERSFKTYSSSPGLSNSASERNRRNLNEQPTSTTVSGKQQKSGKSSYKHVPHSEKPPHLVERRNARERRRVQAVNSAFARLRKCVPLENRNKRISKVKTLQKAIEYIYDLQQVLSNEDDDDEDVQDVRLDRLQAASLNKENSEDSNNWIPNSESNFQRQQSSYFSLGMYDNYAEYPN